MRLTFVGVLVVSVVAAGVVSPALVRADSPSEEEGVAAPSEVAPQLDEVDAGGAAGAQGQSQGRAPADYLCAPDPTGDTVRADDDEPVDEPRADLVEFCADFGSELKLEAAVDEPTDPASDDGWADGAAVYWFVDTDGGGYDHSVVFGADDGELFAEVIEISDDGSETVTCTVDAAYTGGRYVASGIDPDACLDAAGERIDVAVITRYVADGQVAMDVSNTFIAVGRDGDDPHRAVSRLAGADRIATAVEISPRVIEGAN